VIRKMNILSLTLLLCCAAPISKANAEERPARKIAIVRISAIDRDYILLNEHREWERSLTVEFVRTLDDLMKILRIAADIRRTSRLFGAQSDFLLSEEQAEARVRKGLWRVVFDARTRIARRRAAVRGEMRRDFERSIRVLTGEVGCDRVVFLGDESRDLKNARISDESARFVTLLNSR
jgi:hypothetical protein